MVVLFAVIMFQSTPPEAYPGQSQHREPPAGWVCYPKPKISTAATRPHECDCHRMAHATPEDPQCYVTPADPSKQCKVWCWEKDHCLCSTCDMGGHH